MKNPKKCPIICFASDKKESPALSESEAHWYCMSLREREREREREGESTSEKEIGREIAQE